MSSKIYITEETARQARSNNSLSALEERFVHLMSYRIRLQQTADEAKAGTLRKELKTLVKAADLVFGPGAGTRLKKLAKLPADDRTQHGGQAGTSATPTAKSRSYGATAGTSHSASAVLYPYGQKRGTSAYTYGRKRGTSYGAGAGTFVEELPSDLADAWKAGKADGAGAGTPLQQASAAYQKKADEEARYVGWGAGQSMTPKQTSSYGGQAGTSATPTGLKLTLSTEPYIDINWTPYDDFAVGGSYDNATQRKQGKHLAKLIAQKTRGR